MDFISVDVSDNSNQLFSMFAFEKENNTLFFYQEIFAVKNKQIKSVPRHLKDSHYPGAKNLGNGTGYKYAHDYPAHYVRQQYLPDELVGTEYYKPTQNGVERRISDTLKRLKEM